MGGMGEEREDKLREVEWTILTRARWGDINIVTTFFREVDVHIWVNSVQAVPSREGLLLRVLEPLHVFN